MAGFSNDLAQKVINYFFRNATGGTPTTGQCYLALHTADPTDAQAATEVSAGWYTRQAVNFDPPVIGATTVTTANTGAVTFNAVTGGALTVTHWGIFDAATNGNLRASGTWATAKVLNIDDIFKVNVADLVLSFD